MSTNTVRILTHTVVVKLTEMGNIHIDNHELLELKHRSSPSIAASALRRVSSAVARRPSATSGTGNDCTLRGIMMEPALLDSSQF